jgi:hypothetical protein
LFGPRNTLYVFHTCLRPMWRYNYKRG